MQKACTPRPNRAAETVTIVEPKAAHRSADLVPPPPASEREERHANQLAFRRALSVGFAVWLAFCAVDLAVVRYMHAGRLSHFMALRIVGAVAVALSFFLVRSPPGGVLSERRRRAADLMVYTTCGVTMALMCVEFRGIASPYVPGFCLALLSRTVAAPDPWNAGCS